MPNPDANFLNDKVINVSDLDTEYPVPGQDNDSQGFRDNFTVINDNALATKARLEDLEAKTVRIDNNNTFSDQSTGGTARLINATMTGERRVRAPLDNNIIDFDEANYFTLSLTGPVSLITQNLPDNGYFKSIIVRVSSNGGTFDVTWPAGLKFDDANSGFWNNGISSIPDDNAEYFVELLADGDADLYGRYLGKFA